jgi:hypothetical protein
MFEKFHENIKRMEETNKEINKISAEIKKAAEVNDGKKMLDLIQQMTNMVANEIVD